jgi:hypothetical protein
MNFYNEVFIVKLQLQIASPFDQLIIVLKPQ